MCFIYFICRYILFDFIHVHICMYISVHIHVYTYTHKHENDPPTWTAALFGETGIGYVFFPPCFIFCNFPNLLLPELVLLLSSGQRRTPKCFVDRRVWGGRGSAQPWGTPGQEGLRSHRISWCGLIPPKSKSASLLGQEVVAGQARGWG